MTANIPSYVRKIVVQVDEIHREMGRDIAPPTRRALAMAVSAVFKRVLGPVNNYANQM